MEKYAVLQVKNKQYFVKEGSKIVTHKINSKDDVAVLALNKGEELYLGTPSLKDSSVSLDFVEDKRIKTETRRYRSKSRYRKNKSHTDSYAVYLVKSFDNKGSKVTLSEASTIGKDIKTSTKTKKAETKKSASISVNDLGLSDTIVELLVKGGYKTDSDLKKAKRADLVDIKGLGEKKVDQILSKLK